jgi:MFS family permease
MGTALLLSWGVSYYLIGVFGERMAADLGWSLPMVHGGFTAALLVMGAVSGLSGRLIDRHGGRGVMMAGAVLAAAGCCGLALSHDLTAYYASWICLGVAMRLSLYDAAFATLARIGGPEARSAMAQVTLLGGLSSTVFWPFGDALADGLGWRGALFVYAGLSIASVLLHLAIPAGRAASAEGAGGHVPPLAGTPRDRRLAGGLYALAFALAHFLSSAMSAHVIGLLTGLGIAASVAVWISTLRGIGQVAARLAQIVLGRRVHPIDLNLLATLMLPLSFALALALALGGGGVSLAVMFVLVYGSGSGVLSITQGWCSSIIGPTAPSWGGCWCRASSCRRPLLWPSPS